MILRAAEDLSIVFALFLRAAGDDLLIFVALFLSQDFCHAFLSQEGSACNDLSIFVALFCRRIFVAGRICVRRATTIYFLSRFCCAAACIMSSCIVTLGLSFDFPVVYTLAACAPARPPPSCLSCARHPPPAQQKTGAR